MTPEEFLRHEEEVRLAQKAYPEERNISIAYKRWKEARGETPIYLTTADKTLKAAKQAIRQAAWKPCEKCGDKAILEGICGSCVEGRKGYKSKFTCEGCLHRELSKKDYNEWLKELYSSSKESSLPKS